MAIMVQAESSVALAEIETDEILLARFLGGDDDGFMTLFKRYEMPLIRYLRHLTGQSELAKDLCQETLTRLIQKPPRAGMKGSLRAWLFRVAHNLAMDSIRKSSRMADAAPALDEQPEKATDLQQRLTDNELGSRLCQLIMGLPEQMREVLCLRIFADLRFREIARVARMPLGTALWRMNRAVDHLRKSLEEEGWL